LHSADRHEQPSRGSSLNEEESLPAAIQDVPLKASPSRFADAQLASRHEALKTRAAERMGADSDAYMAAKSPFIVRSWEIAIRLSDDLEELLQRAPRFLRSAAPALPSR
jgi:hypothetical protein